MSVTLQEMINQVEFYTGSYNTGSNSQDKKIRAINTAIGQMKRILGFPSDEKIYSFFFSDDQNHIDLPVDFDEAIMIRYTNNTYNTPQYRWEYRSYTEILSRLGVPLEFAFSFIPINGSKQLLMSGLNIRRGQQLYDFEAVGSWTDEDDASGLAVDADEFYAGAASLSFDITNSAGLASLQITGQNWDFDTLFTKHGYIKFWTFMTDNNIDDVTLKLMTDDSNYYSIVVTEDDKSVAFAQDEWIKLGFAMDDAVATGSPDRTNITKLRVEYDLGAGFTSAVDFRIDQMFTTFPDEMELIYYSSYKGTDTAGTTNRTDLTTLTDKIGIGEFFEDYKDTIAMKAATLILPTLRSDKDFMANLRSEWTTMMKTLGRSYPRKRMQQNNLRHTLRR